MEYEELLNLHPKLINQKKDWESIFKYIKPLFDEYNNEWFYRWISEFIKYDDLVPIWYKFKDQWRLIQKYMNKGYKICYLCGFISGKISIHLKSHNLTYQDWVDEFTLIPRSSRLCKNCEGPTKFYKSGGYYQDFCCRSCKSSYIIKLNNEKYGTKWTSPDNLTDDQLKNSYGIMDRNSTEYLNLLNRFSDWRSSCTKKRNEIYGYNWHPGNWTEEQIKIRGFRGADDPEFINKVIIPYKSHQSSAGSIGGTIGGKTGALTALKLYGCNYHPEIWTDDQINNRGLTGRDDPKYIELCKYYKNIRLKGSRKAGLIYQELYGAVTNSFKTKFYFNELESNLDSQFELWTLLWILTKLSNKNIKFLGTGHPYPNYTSEFNGKGASSDLRFSSIKCNSERITNFEIHDHNDIEGINRKRFCTELHKEKFILVPLWLSNFHYNDLLSKGYNVDEIRDRLSEYNRSDKLFEFHYPNDLKFKSELTTHSN